jgi:hypothetical protein
MLKLRMLLDEGRFIASTARPDAALNLSPLVYGDVVPIELSAYRRSQHDSSAFEAVSLTGYDISLAVGFPNSRPSLGFWTLVFDGSTSAPISAEATAAEVSVIISPMTGIVDAGGITVTGDPGDWIFSFSGAGVQTTGTITFQGSTTVTASITALTVGTTDTPAQWRVQLMESAPAGIIPEAWTSGSTTPASTVTGSNKIWTLALDSSALTGYFTLTANSNTTGYLPLSASALEIKTALELVEAPCQVIRSANGGFVIAFQSNTTLTVDDSLLTIPPTKTAFLNLSTPGIREMLDGASFVPAELSVTLTGETSQVTGAIIGVTIKMPVSAPAASTFPVYQKTAFQPLLAYTGADSLEALPTRNGAITTNSVAFTVVSGVPHTWQLQAGTDATDADAGYVRPSDYDASTNARVWVQIA